MGQLMPRCGNCGKGHTQHLKGRACDNYTPKKMGVISENQRDDLKVLKKMLEAHLVLQHELYGGTRCEAAGKLKHTCWGPLVLDHVELKSTHELKFSLGNTQILCEVANGMKGSKRTDYRGDLIKKMLVERYPGVWEEPERKNDEEKN